MISTFTYGAWDRIAQGRAGSGPAWAGLDGNAFGWDGMGSICDLHWDGRLDVAVFGCSLRIHLVSWIWTQGNRIA